MTKVQTKPQSGKRKTKKSLLKDDKAKTPTAKKTAKKIKGKGQVRKTSVKVSKNNSPTRETDVKLQREARNNLRKLGATPRPTSLALARLKKINN
jgi:hypothetical protein